MPISKIAAVVFALSLPAAISIPALCQTLGSPGTELEFAL